MSAGYSGTYALNGTEILKPTSHRWVEREMIGVDGNGRPLYPSVTEYELNWQLMSPASFFQLVNAHRYSIQTGTVVTDLPQWGNGDYLFYSYSGTYISMPSFESFFNEHYEGVSLIVRNVRTD